MFDPNVLAFLSVIISAIGIIGALGGVYLGSKLNSRYMMEADKRKRNDEKIEEIYTLVLQIQKWAEDTSSKVKKAPQVINYLEDNTIVRYNDIKPSVDRIITLVRLYIPQILETTQRFLDDFTRLRDPLYHLQYLASKNESDKKQEVEDELYKARDNFAKSYVDLLFALEKLVG